MASSVKVQKWNITTNMHAHVRPYMQLSKEDMHAFGSESVKKTRTTEHAIDSFIDHPPSLDIKKWSKLFFANYTDTNAHNACTLTPINAHTQILFYFFSFFNSHQQTYMCIVIWHQTCRAVIWTRQCQLWPAGLGLNLFWLNQINYKATDQMGPVGTLACRVRAPTGALVCLPEVKKNHLACPVFLKAQVNGPVHL
jgi:hypothetical protein